MGRRSSEYSFLPDELKTPEIPDVPFTILDSESFRQSFRDRVGALIEKVHRERVDVIFFLDKSARPVAWLFQELWNQDQGLGKRPEIKFINIGTGHDVRGVMNRVRYDDQVSPDVLEKALGSAVKSVQEVFTDPFTNKSILVVDEISASGASLNAATQVLAQAFPQTKEVRGLALFSTPGFLPWMMLPGVTGGIDFDNEILVRRMDPNALAEWKQTTIADLVKKIDGKYGIGVMHLKWDILSGVFRLKKQRTAKTLQKYTRNPVLADLKVNMDHTSTALMKVLSSAPETQQSAETFVEYLGEWQSIQAEILLLTNRVFDLLYEVQRENEDREKIQVLKKLSELLRDLCYQIKQATERSSRQLSLYDRSVLSLIGPTRDVKYFHDISLQLRREIKAIAKQPPSIST